MKYCVLKKVYLKPKPLAERNPISSPSHSADNSLSTTQHSAMELEAAAALLMLRYQYDIQSAAKIVAAATATAEASTTNTTTTIETQILPESSRSPTPPPPCMVDNCTPKEQQVRVTASNQPLKKRSIPSHLLRRSLTPAKQQQQQQQVPSINNISQNGIVKAKIKARTPLPSIERNNESSSSKTCNKALLKSCRNMIREFLDSQEKI